MEEVRSKGVEDNEIRVSGIHIEWEPQKGTCTFEKMPVAMMWVDTTLAGLMSGVQAMVGTERFLLALQSEGRKSVESDWEVIAQSPDFFQGFKAIANIAAVAGWGAWELTSLDEEKKECRFRVADSWEGLYQKALGVGWGSGMLAGKMAGYCSRLFGTNCWANQTGFIAKGDPCDEFVVGPSSRSVEREIENLLASDEATRADMAVALHKLEKEMAERTRAEEAVRESEEKYRKLMEAANDAIFIAEVDTGEIIDANPKAQEFLGLPLEKIIGMHQSQLHPPAEAERYRSIFREHSMAGGLIGEEIYVVDSAGRRIPVEISAGAMEVRGKHLIYGIFRDLRERRRGEEALRRSEEKYRLLVNQIPAVVFKGYADWSVDFFDNKVEELTGYSKEDFDFRRLKWSDLFLPEDLEEITEPFIEGLRTDGSYVREYRIRRKDGEIRWVQSWGQIFFDPEGRIEHVSGVTLDIT